MTRGPTRYLEKCQELGIKNIHVHKGPTIKPLDRDAFDVSDVDHCATDFPELNFVVEHVGLPRLEDFCWIATQESNVYGGLAVAIPFIHTRPALLGADHRRVAVLDRRGQDPVRSRLRAVATEVADREVRRLPDPRGHAGRVQADHHRPEEKILGLNAASLYDIDVPAELQLPTPGQDTVEVAAGAKESVSL